MPRNFLRLAPAFVLLFQLAATAFTQGSRPQTARPGVDRYGDPLPAGALVRLGSTRFRHAGLSDYVFVNGGKTLLTAGSDRVLRFWEMASGRQVREVKLQGGAGPGRLVTLSPDGRTLVAHDKQQLVFWDVQSGEQLKTLPGPGGPYYGYIYFSPDGKTLAVGASDWVVSFWDWQAGTKRDTPLAVLPDPMFMGGSRMDSTFHGSFSPDGKWFVASAASYQPLAVYAVATAREQYRLECYAYSSAVSADSKRLAVCSMRNDRGERETVIRFFDLTMGKQIASFPQGNDHGFFSLAFSPDGAKLACGFSDNSRVLDTTTGRVLFELSGRPLDLTFSPDGTILIARGGTYLRVWDVATGKEMQERPGIGGDPAVAVSPSGALLAEADWLDRVVRTWETSTGRLVRALPLTGKENRYVRNLAFASDDRTLISCQHLGLLRFWDLATGRERRSIQLADPSRKIEDSYFYRFCLTADGKQIGTLERLFAPAPTRLASWDTATGQLLWQRGLPGEVRLGQWSSDGRNVTVPVEDVLTVFDTNAVVVRRQIPGGGDLFKLSPDDRLLAVRQTKQSGNEPVTAVSIWETDTGAEVGRIPTGWIAHLDLAPDNRTLVTTNQDSIVIWDLATGMELRRLALPLAGKDSFGRTFVFGLQLTPDGRRALTTMADQTALLWDISLPRREPIVVHDATEKQLAGWWADLLDKNPRIAYAALWRLADCPEGKVIEFFRTHLRPAAEPDAAKLHQLILALNSETFKVREAAIRQLEELGSAAFPVAREVLAKNPALEVQRRLEKLLSRPHEHSSEVLRSLRAVQLLERFPSKPARQLLEDLAAGGSHAELTLEAKRSLRRLAMR